MAVDGRELRAMREAARVSLRQMAQHLDVSVSHLSYVERNEGRVATPSLVNGYERVLGRRVDQGEQADSLDDVRRRGFVGAVAAAAVGAASPQSVARLLDAMPLPVPDHVGLSEVEAVEQAADLYMRLDLAHGGAMAATMAGGSLKWAGSLLGKQMSHDTRGRLSAACALLADRLGWASYDAGRSRAARDLLIWALDVASHGPDRDLRAHIILDMSTVLTDAGAAADGVEILRIALGDERISQGERANLHAVCARHCGTSAQIQSGLRHIALAQEALGRPDQLDPPAWSRRVTFSAGHHASALGLALFELGQEEAARQQLETAVARLSGSRVRTGLRCRARLAVLCMRAGDRAGGEAHSRQVLAEATGVQSKRITADLAMLAGQAARLGYRRLATDIRHQLETTR